jgi:PII-like signaling protein
LGTYPELEILQIYIDEDQTHEGRRLYEAIVEEARNCRLTGAMVSRGMMGFWKYGPVSTTKLLALSQNLPVMIQIAGEHERIETFLPKLDFMVKQGLVTLETARVVINRDNEE